ncbi:MAG TPA: hypothetical protein DCP31_02570 [Cyanobacteria bacterium UBA8543]|nr:hypothetical protein [Cyanobacteria bacterium UBA8543]
MQVAKALTGKYAGQPIAANKQELTHELCREWKLYCPECYQFVHLRSSYKIKSYFAHYDVEDKSCKYRQTSSNESAKYSREASAKGQDLESIQQEFESIFSRNCEGFDNEINEIKKNIKKNI